MKPQKFIRCNKQFAVVWGLEVAVVMEQVKYWLTRNAENPDSLHEGTVWFYCSIRELTAKYFPYWTPRQLASLLDYMVKLGLLRVGRFNKMKYDRTKWYTVVDNRILEEEDYVPPLNSKTKRRSISRAPVSNPLDPRVKGSDADVRGSDPSVEGSDTDVKSNSPSSGTYTTTKQQLKETEKDTEKEELNILSKLHPHPSDVDGGKEPPSSLLPPFSQKETNEDDFIPPLPRTEGADLSRSFGPENNTTPLTQEKPSPKVDSPSELESTPISAAPCMSRWTKEEISRAFEDMFRDAENEKRLRSAVRQSARVTL